MLAVLYFLAFEGCGAAIVRFLLPKKSPVARVWLGLALGLALMMWLPALCAFAFAFTLTAHWTAAALLPALTAAAWLFRDRSPVRGMTKKEKHLLLMLACVALPLTAIGGVLQYTHNIKAWDNGALYTGQSTYGDLQLHLAIASSLRNASFPPDYSILPGALLSYPFLADSLSASFMLMGFSLRAAIAVPGAWMMGLVFAGYVILAHRMADGKRAAVLSALFFFLNGGLGFLYLIDMQGEALGGGSLQSAVGLADRIRNVLNGWYQTPANHTDFDVYNLRWSNVIVDMMVPQRTTLAGWTQMIPCLYLLYDALRPEGIVPYPDERDGSAAPASPRFPWRQTLVLGVMAGMLPMINTHCFLALGLVSFGWMAWDLIKNRRHIRARLGFWALYGGAAAALAAPQLFTWTFRQAVGNESFLQFHFNWVNNTASGGGVHLRDFYLWFYIKNIGVPFVLILISLLEKNEKRRFIAAGAFTAFLAAELIQFQPNPYDNNKLFYIWYMLCAVLAADYAVTLLTRLTHRPARYAAAVVGAVLCFTTGGLAVAREINSAETMHLFYPAYSAEDVEAAEYVENNTPQHAVFLTANDLCNFVSSLAGRTIVCGPDTWLVYHGFDTRTRQKEISAFYADPAGHESTLVKYGVEYILVRDAECHMAAGEDAWNRMNDWERRAYRQNLNDRLSQLFPLVYVSESGGVSIYAVEGLPE